MEQTAFSKNSDAYTTYTSYEIEEGKLKTHVQDKNGEKNVLSVNTYTDGSEHTLKTVKEHANENETSATTEFEYDGIGQLLSVKDPADKLTTYTYDMAGRKQLKLLIMFYNFCLSSSGLLSLFVPVDDAKLGQDSGVVWTEKERFRDRL